LENKEAVGDLSDEVARLRDELKKLEKGKSKGNCVIT